MRKGLLSAILMIAAIALGVLATAQENPKPNDTALAGTWEAVEGELAGKPLPPEVVRAGKLVLMRVNIRLGTTSAQLKLTLRPTLLLSPSKETKARTKGKPSQGFTNCRAMRCAFVTT